MKGVTGKILLVDLSTRTWEVQDIPEAVYEGYLSGIGLAAYITTQTMPPGADPLGPDNLLGFVNGLLTGSAALFSGRWLVTGKSPLTGGWGDANCGGNLGPAIKQCGYDGIFFKGIASEPIYLYADGEAVEIRSASHLWGKDATETEELLCKKSGGKKTPRVACIGQAGERLSLISGICNDRGRIAARSGLGAVMGSKKLKAVVLAGSRPTEYADSPEIKRLSKELNTLVPKEDFKYPGWMLPFIVKAMNFGKNANRADGLLSLSVMRTWGTGAGNQLCVVTGDAPVKNWAGTSKDYTHRPIAPDILAKRTLKKYHCHACPLACGAISSVSNGFNETHRPEYETAMSLGAMLLNNNLDSLLLVNELLNRAGMDSISAGATIAFVMECFENGLIDQEDTNGLELRWGNSAAIIALVKKMIAREGFGDVLADGVLAAARRIGNGAERFAMHAGGQELPMHDPKYDPGYGLHYVVEPTPGRHTIGSGVVYETLRLWTRVSWALEVPQSYPASERYIADANKGKYAAASSMTKMLIDTAGLCILGLQIGVDRFPLFEYLNAATGWEKSPDDYMQIGKRIQTLRHLFNIREGIDPVQVKLPGRVYGNPPPKVGANKGKGFDVDAMRVHYWDAMGWNPDTGVPLPETLKALGLEELNTLPV